MLSTKQVKRSRMRLQKANNYKYSTTSSSKFSSALTDMILGQQTSFKKCDMASVYNALLMVQHASHGNKEDGDQQDLSICKP